MSTNSIGDFRVLHDIARAINSTLSTDEVLRAIVKTVTGAVHAKGCCILMKETGSSQLVNAASYGLSENYLSKGQVSLDPIIAEVSEGNPVLVLDAVYDRRVQYPEASREEKIASILSVPLTYLGELIGILRIYTAERRFFSEEEMDFVKAVADLSATALSRAREHENQIANLESRTNACYLELDKLQQGRRYLMRFLAMVGHDLKSPIAAVESYLNVMKACIAGPLNEKQKNMMDRSSIRLRELVALINDLVDVSRLEAGQIPMEVVKVPLEPAIQEALEVAKVEAEQKGLQLRTELASPLPQVIADKRRLQQVLVNLLTNAVRYTPAPGEVILRVRDTDGVVLFEIIDTGIGIPPEDFPHIFEEFFRGHNVEAKGTGLGLSIVHRIVEYLGGKIWVDSPCPETGKGSKFSFTLLKEMPSGGIRGVEAQQLPESLA
ncbi:MAG: Histidine kinase protein [Dehalococcoidales bacterium]|nr:Histidine kinase protein [Dehalococcoidales bacterium]